MNWMTRRTAVLLALAALAVPVPLARAVSYAPLVHDQPGDETARGVGRTLYLFHSGTNALRERLHEGDVLVVSRISSSCEARPVGKIRLTGQLGENYLEAVVVEGSVKVNDIARQGEISCLVLSAEPCGAR